MKNAECIIKVSLSFFVKLILSFTIIAKSYIFIGCPIFTTNTFLPLSIISVLKLKKHPHLLSKNELFLLCESITSSPSSIHFRKNVILICIYHVIKNFMSVLLPLKIYYNMPVTLLLLHILIFNTTKCKITMHNI